MSAELEAVIVMNTRVVISTGFDVRVLINLPDIVQDADGPAMNNLHFTFTHEGVIMDVVDDDGKITGTTGAEYIDLIFMTPDTNIEEARDG